MRFTFDQLAKSHGVAIRVSLDNGNTWQYAQVCGNAVELGAGMGVVVLPEASGMRMGHSRHSVRAITKSGMESGDMIVEEDQTGVSRTWSYGVLSG